MRSKPSLLFLVALLKALLCSDNATAFTSVVTGCRVALRSSGAGGIIAKLKSDDQDDDDDDEWIAAEVSEVIVNDFDENMREDQEWVPDREKAKRKRARAHAYQTAAINTATPRSTAPKTAAREATKIPDKTKKEEAPKATPYTDEEEEVIRSMGGKTKSSPSKREPGYLGDSTLQEIATDYSVPICYIADVLCMWGTPVPINVHDRLGDLVTGEQAFAILEAINSLDISALNDRYSNQSLLNVCYDWDIDVSEGFEMAMKEGWSLPFGVQTVLRVEQEEELVRVLGSVTM